MNFFCRLFDESINTSYPGISENDLNQIKEKKFAKWLEKHVRIYENSLHFFIIKIFINLLFCQYISGGG